MCCFSGVVVEGCCVFVVATTRVFRDSEGRPAFICSKKFWYFFVTISSATVPCVCVFDYIFQKTGKFFLFSIQLKFI